MYDVIIVGGGPAGLTAGIYLARAGYKCAIFERETIGGQIASSPLVENYPGYKKISGSELADNLYEQVDELGVDILIENVLKVEQGKVISEEGEYTSKAIILATGAKYRTLGLDSEVDYIGSGIHFCVSCDGAFYKDKVTCVVGGSNSACGNALYLSNISSKVYLIYRGKKLKCDKILYDKIMNTPNIEVMYDSNLIKYNGDGEITSIDVDVNGKVKNIPLSAVFLAIGLDASTSLANGLLDMDESEYFISNNTKTKVEGVFVAGDCVSKNVRQLTTAVNDGTVAAYSVMDYLREKENQ